MTMLQTLRQCRPSQVMLALANGLILALIGLTTTVEGNAAESKGVGATQAGETNRLSGRALAKQYCSACHVFPEPELLDKKTWNGQTLRRMRIRMGLSPGEIDRHPEGALL
ncbi:MAG: hypothetical protein JWM99_5063, partial [Verrucomicrobiales bacterium]|nr:hypothetical protein [Verrucomicrobiales bacterium]